MEAEWKLKWCIGGIARMLIWYAGLVALWLFFRSYLLFLGIVLFPILAGLSVGSLWRQRRNLQLRMLLPGERVGRNAVLELKLVLEYPGKLFCFTADVVLQLTNHFTGYQQVKKEHLWIAPGRKTIRSYHLDSRYAGLLEASAASFVVYDLFHVAGCTGCRVIPAQTFCWPGTASHGEETLSQAVEGFPAEEGTRNRGIDYNPDYEIREYRIGDELKDIHWKLSAGKQKWVVKERLHSGKNRVNIVLDLGPDEKENDTCMDSLYELCTLFLEKEYPVELYWIDGRAMLQSRFFCETGEMEGVVAEILSNPGIREQKEGAARMRAEHPGENFVYVRTGAYKGEYLS